MGDIPFDINQKHYTDYFSYPGRSKIREKIWKAAFGEQYPEGLNHYGYLTNDELSLISDHLIFRQGSKLLDIGCGAGGPGLFIAEQKMLRLTGVDPIQQAVDQALEFSKAFKLAYKPKFMRGHFCDIPLESDSVDMAISIDSLWPVYDKMAALKEAKRVIRQGGRFIFTNWDIVSIDPGQALEHAGFKLIDRWTDPGWKSYQEAVYDGIIKNIPALQQEMGAAANLMIYEAGTSREYLDNSIRRLYILEAK